MNASLPRRKLSGLAYAMLLTAVLTLVLRAPAVWIGDWLASQGRLRLIDARGTVWRGSAVLGVSDGRQVTTFPGRIAWEFNLAAAAAGRMGADIAHPWLAAPVSVFLAADAVKLQPGRADLPAAALSALGAPFNTVRPGGALGMRWTDVKVKGGQVEGTLQIDWRDAQSALSTVSPLGNYRLHVSGKGVVAHLRLETLTGPLRMQGSGTLQGGRVRFKGMASADPDLRHALNGILSVLGPRSGDDAILVLDT